MPSSLYVPILITGMIVTGSSNSLWSKWQDMQCVENCDDPNPANRVLYEQPVWQTLQMFLGEMLCFLPILYTFLVAQWRSRRSNSIKLPATPPEDTEVLAGSISNLPPLTGWRVFLMWLPAFCDLTGTTLMNIGLLYTPVSIYQMTRGALVLFVGLLSFFFLNRKLYVYQWISLFIVMGGVSLVGLSGSMIKDAIKETQPGPLMKDLYSDSSPLERMVRRYVDGPAPEPVDQPEATKVLIGIFFILFAQIFTATQFVVEEKILSRYSVGALEAVGYEGLFGGLTVLLLFPILATQKDKSTFFDIPRGWHQMVDVPTVLYSGIAIAISISLFNFFGLSVTRYVSATARSLTDTCRTLSIWIVSLMLGWEHLLFPTSLLQMTGFAGLVYGTFLFNDLVTPPKFLRPKLAAADLGYTAVTAEDEEEGRRHLAEEHLDDTATLPAGGLGVASYDAVGEPHRRPNTAGRANQASNAASS